MTRVATFVACTLLLLACGQKASNKTKEPTSSGGLPIPDAGVDTGAPADTAGDGPARDAVASADDDASDAPAADATGADGANADAGADLAPDASPRVAAYQQFLADAWSAWRTRWAACFNSAPEALGPERSPLADDFADLHAFSLDHGLVTLDAAKAQA
jgi:hypothetical protein